MMHHDDLEQIASVEAMLSTGRKNYSQWWATIAPEDEKLQFAMVPQSSLDHAGILILSRHDDLITYLSTHAYEIIDQFPSQVIAERLTRIYNRNVSAMILKAQRNNLLLELFSFNGSLPDSIIRTEALKRNHYAVRFQPGIDTASIINLIRSSTAELLDCGINTIEKSTVVYLRLSSMTIEVFIPGIHSYVIDQLTKEIPE